jgi:O-antigen biosynthesis protein WbqP
MIESKVCRFFNLALAIFLLIFFSPLFILLFLFLFFASNGHPIYWSKRVGFNNILFVMPKFRTMRLNTPEVASNLLQFPNNYLILGGAFLRKTSLDELPQLWCIVKGDMNFVGPRPALFNQYDLIALRTYYGIDKLLPGLTGLAQINGRDELSIPIKVQYDLEYLQKQSFWFDMKILVLTFLKVVRRDGVSH